MYLIPNTFRCSQAQNGAKKLDILLLPLATWRAKKSSSPRFFGNNTSTIKNNILIFCMIIEYLYWHIFPNFIWLFLRIIMWKSRRIETCWPNLKVSWAFCLHLRGNFFMFNRNLVSGCRAYASILRYFWISPLSCICQLTCFIFSLSLWASVTPSLCHSTLYL